MNITRLIMSALVTFSLSGALCNPVYAETTTKAHSSNTTTSANAPSEKADIKKVDINTADAKAIAAAAKQAGLKGIGIKRAEAIVAYRKDHGSFKSFEDLENVRGISTAYIKKNQQYLEKAFVKP